MVLALKKDKYKLARGAYSRLLNLYCRVCKNHVAVYQKDGSGNIRRMYLDRIFLPKNIVGLEKKSLSKVKNLVCKSCKEIIGTPYLYAKEKRAAFKIYQDAIVAKVRKINLIRSKLKLK
jgi:hypothetical protein